MKALLLSLLIFSSVSSANYCLTPPTFTKTELYSLQKWSAGGAFNIFSIYVNVDFDLKAYRADCPNWAAFGYGLASGPQCTLGVNVASDYENLVWLMTLKKAKEPDQFEEFYWQEAEKLGFAKYLTKK